MNSNILTGLPASPTNNSDAISWVYLSSNYLNLSGGTLTGSLTTVGISNSTTGISNSASYTQTGSSTNTFTGATGISALLTCSNGLTVSSGTTALKATNISGLLTCSASLTLSSGNLTMSPQTASTVLTLNSSKQIVSSSVTTTTLGYLDATSSIQTQFNNITSNYLTSATAASTYQTISGMSSYLTTSSAASTYLTITNASSTYQTISGMSSYLTTSSAASTYLALTGGTLSGNLTFSGSSATINCTNSLGLTISSTGGGGVTISSPFVTSSTCTHDSGCSILGNLDMYSNIIFSADNSYYIGTSSVAPSQIYTHLLNSLGTFTLGSGTNNCYHYNNISSPTTAYTTYSSGVINDGSTSGCGEISLNSSSGGSNGLYIDSSGNVACTNLHTKFAAGTVYCTYITCNNASYTLPNCNNINVTGNLIPYNSPYGVVTNATLGTSGAPWKTVYATNISSFTTTNITATAITTSTCAITGANLSLGGFSEALNYTNPTSWNGVSGAGTWNVLTFLQYYSGEPYSLCGYGFQSGVNTSSNMYIMPGYKGSTSNGSCTTINLYNTGTSGLIYFNNNIEIATNLACDSTVQISGTLTMAAQILPNADASYSFGNASYRWGYIWSNNGTIQTSDQNDKNSIVELDSTLALNVVNDLKPSSYKWNNDPTNSTSFGLIAQDVESTMSKYSVPAYEGLLYVPASGSTDSYGINYSNVIPFLIGAIQKLTNQVSSLQNQLNALSPPS